MGKDGDGITVDQMGEYAGQGPKRTYRRCGGVSHREPVKGAGAESQDM